MLLGRALKFIYQAHASIFVYLPLAEGPTKGGEESYYFSTAAGNWLGVCVSGGGVNVCRPTITDILDIPSREGYA